MIVGSDESWRGVMSDIEMSVWNEWKVSLPFAAAFLEARRASRALHCLPRIAPAPARSARDAAGRFLWYRHLVAAYACWRERRPAAAVASGERHLDSATTYRRACRPPLFAVTCCSHRTPPRRLAQPGVFLCMLLATVCSAATRETRRTALKTAIVSVCRLVARRNALRCALRRKGFV